MKLNLLITLFLFPLAGFLSSCGEKTTAASTPKSDVIPVKVIPVSQNDKAASFTVSGQFTTDDEVMLSFKTGGVIQKIMVKEGDAVKLGQVLAVLNRTEIDAQAQQAQLAYEKAQRDYKRAQNLYADSVATLEQLQNAETGLKLARQQLQAVQFNRSYSEIRAPKNGYVLRKLANEGQVVGAGVPVLQTNGAQSSNWLLRVGISDREWALLKKGDEAVIETEALPGQVLQGIVLRKSEGVDPSSGSFVADIKLVSTGKAAIASGMFGKATIHINAGKEQATGWAIPYDALLDADGSTGYVFITNDNRTAKKQKVTIAGMEKHNVIVSDGLQNAARLIISGSAYLTDNSPITITQ